MPAPSPPSSGKIHPLPVKIVYTIDSSPRSYVTVLNDRHDVYIHPLGGDHQQGAPPVGSCCLKGIARGICFASPECIPNQSTLDFSIYNLDPSLRSNSARALQSTSNAPIPDEPSSWTGKGFLSWVLSEPNNGSTLIKGRIVREHDFDPTGFNEEGGLEGLMRLGQRREVDGKGWGLEVSVSLKVVNPEGKSEFAGRQQFEEMLMRGRTLTANVNGTTTTSSQSQARRPVSQAPLPPPRVNGGLSIPTPPSGLGSNSHNHVPGNGLRPSPSLHPIPTPPAITHRPSSDLHRPSSEIHRPSSSASHRPSPLPPSSLPREASSSIHSRPSSVTDHRPSSAAPTPASLPPPLPPPPQSQPQTTRSERHTTPPRNPRPKSPPPSTPRRATLRDLLTQEGKMLPEVAKSLINNPNLLRMLKAVPPPSPAKKQEVMSTPKGKGINNNNAKSPGTPTPSTSHTVKPGLYDGEGCCNCGTTHSELWRTKTAKDGSKKKVCNGCGLYFNKHKRMRPPELWPSEIPNPTSSPADHSLNHQDKKSKFDHHHHELTPGIRSSPRLHRDPHPHPSYPTTTPTESPRKRQRSGRGAGPGPISHPSPRMATRSSASNRTDDEVDFSPSTLFATSPAQGPVQLGLANGNGGLGGGGDGGGRGEEEVGEMDIEALIAQISSDPGFNLDALFAGVGQDHGGGDGQSGGGVGTGGMDHGEMMDLLSAWEGGGEGKVGGNGAV